MIAELSQKGFSYKRKIIIQDTTVVFQASKNENELSIPYEELTAFKENYKTQVKHLRIYVRVLSYLTTISLIASNYIDFISNLWIFFAVGLVGVFTFQLLMEESVWKIKLQKGTYIFINKKDPNEDVVNNFIDQLFEQRKKYLRETYLHINKNLAYEPQFYNLQWLRQINVINDKEFDKFLKELDALFNTDKKSIGF